jgi:chromosomal replication initiator protein
MNSKNEVMHPYSYAGSVVIEDKTPITIESIINEACKTYNMTLSAMKQVTRRREVVEARQAVFYFAALTRCLSLEDIGAIFFKDHATVIHGKRTIMNLIETDKVVRYRIKQIEIRLILMHNIGNLINND